MAGVALMALGWLWWRTWVPFDAVVAAAVCVASAALGDFDLHFAWRVWHLAHRHAFCVAGTALAHAAKAAGCHLGLLIVQARWLWLYSMITH